MHFTNDERMALFIDGANLYATAKALELDIDYRALLNTFNLNGNLKRAMYYTALTEDHDRSSLRPLVDWLDYNGYSMVTKSAKEFVDGSGRRRVKGNMDIEIAVDILEMTKYLDHVVLFTGDGDFRRLVEAVQRRCVKVTIVSTVKSNPSMIADELRRQADYFVDLVDIKGEISREGLSDLSEQPKHDSDTSHFNLV